MKNKLSIAILSRWIIAPLLVGCLIAWSASPAHSGDTPTAREKPAAPKQASNTSPASNTADTNADVQELKARIKELEAMELEGQRKTIDWWFSFLAVLTAIMAIFGALIPFLMARKDKEIIEQDKAQIRKLLDEVKGMKDDAEGSVKEIHRHEAEAKAAKETVLSFQSGAASSSEKEVREAVDKIEQDKTADPLLRLRAEAIAASQAEYAAKAYALWKALTELEPNDAGAQFNAGYWAFELSVNAQHDEKIHWLRLAENHYSQAHSIKPDSHATANNWGLALSNEAEALPRTELNAAHKLRAQAIEKYRLALSIKPNSHEAASNYGNVLANEAHALSTIELNSARALWVQAGEMYQLALSIKSDMHSAADSWGNALATEANALPEIQLDAARALWKQAGEKHQLALRIKPDDHQAASNYANDLADEARVITISNIEQSQQLLNQAEQLLLAHVDAAPDMVSYNLACVYGQRKDVQSCLHWLTVCQAHKKLPDCAHLNTDKDLDAVRESPEFIAWLATVCNDNQD